MTQPGGPGVVEEARVATFLAERFGGGGHKLAAGARTDDPLPATRDVVLKAVEESLGVQS